MNLMLLVSRTNVDRCLELPHLYLANYYYYYYFLNSSVDTGPLTWKDDVAVT